jgi:DNA-binding SARP family transcriptional activator/streptogramin lyase
VERGNERVSRGRSRVVRSLAKGADVNFDILGPIAIRDPEGSEIRLPAGRERSLLVLLLINRGNVVSVDRIIEALWGEQPPETAAKAVQGYVSHLRRTLDPDRASGGSEGLIVTKAPGYALQAQEVDIDAARFEGLAAEGTRALDEGSAADAAAAFDAALGLWRGPALAEFAYDEFAQAEIHRLGELRLVALEDRADALLRLGRNAEVAADLGPLVAENPLRERLRTRLMLALYRCGRQADALEIYRVGRRLLAGELGLEPGPELQRLEQAILAQDPALDGPPAVAPAPRPTETGPAAPPTSSAPGKPRRRLVLVVAGIALASVVAVAVAVVLTRSDSPSAVGVRPPAVVAVDPRTNTVVASVAAGSKPISIAAGGGRVWVGDQGDGTVTEIDPATRLVAKVIGIGAPAVDLAVGSGGVWVATGSFGDVVRIDPGLGAIAERIPLGVPGDPIVPPISSIAVGGGRVWVGAKGGVVVLDVRSGAVLDRVSLDRADALQLAAGGGAVWATIISSRAKRIDMHSAKVTAEFYAGDFVFAVAVAPEGVWIGGNRGQLWKVDPVTGSSTLSVRIGAFPGSIAVGGGAVWVTLPEEGLLLRLDPETGDVQKIRIGGSPEDVVFDHGLVWLAVKKRPPPQG